MLSSSPYGAIEHPYHLQRETIPLGRSMLSISLGIIAWHDFPSKADYSNWSIPKMRGMKKSKRNLNASCR